MATPLQPLALTTPEQSAAAGASRSLIAMDTLVTLQLTAPPGGSATAALDRAAAWFSQVEVTCSRFDPTSELCRLSERIGQPTAVSDLLFQALTFALAVAAASEGAFDPTVGHQLVARGFNRNYQTGAIIAPGVASDGPVSYRDVVLQPAGHLVTLTRPLLLDLGAVAKGLAIDLAGRELAPLGGFAIDAGGDLLVAGPGPAGAPWRIGLRHPRQPDALLAAVALTDGAVCTSGDYERHRGRCTDHHLIEPTSGRPAAGLASVTVIAPSAMVADALATAAFILGPQRGRRLLSAQGVAGLLVTPRLTRHYTANFRRYLQ